MLILSLNSLNVLDIVCNDLLTIENPVYLWRIVNKMTKVESLIELENQQPVNPRFDQFNLTLPDDLDLKAGMYEWWVYQSDTTGRTDYDDMPELSSGDLRVNNATNENESYEPTGEIDYEYNG